MRVVILLAVLLLAGCRIERYEIERAIETCGSLDKIHRVDTSFGGFVQCSDGIFRRIKEISNQ